MPVASLSSMQLAITNVAKHGDTDIFPYPIENHLFHDMSNEALDLLKEIDADFDGAVARMPILSAPTLSVVGYTGFRQGTQIDPVWNVYLLALVLTIAPEIEQRRVGPEYVFSYRYAPDIATGYLFNRDVGWKRFQEVSCEQSRATAFVLRCDISDFYSRIYHHRLENALKQSTGNGDAIKRIMVILRAISDGASYGLPVGGPASRILSEILLNRIDRLLISESIRFCRFVDDFVIFAENREDAYSSLIKLSGLLLANEGLSLQKSKTRLMSTKEFLGTSEFAEESKLESEEEEEIRLFKRLRLHYDPYSPTAADDYAELEQELERFDIVGMLGRELAKSRIDESLTRKLVSAVRHLDSPVQADAIRSMLKSLDLLYPIFPSVMLLCRNVLSDLQEDVKRELFETLRNLIAQNSYITQVPTNLAFALRVLAGDQAEETEILLSNLFKQPLNMMLKRDIILMMAHRKADYWISNCRRNFSTLTDWERRALLVASYILEDEGSHWRESIKKDLHAFDKLVLSWASQSKQKNLQAWRVPV